MTSRKRDVPTAGQPASAEGLEVAGPLLDSLNWFADCDPELRAPVRVTLDGWNDPAIRTTAATLAQSMQDITQDVVTCDSVSLDEGDHLVLPFMLSVEPAWPAHGEPHRA
jgi:hypothetical protein